MPVIEKKRKIDVVATAKPGGGYDFKMFEDVDGIRKERTELDFCKNKDGVYKIGWYMVEFKLDRPDGSNLKFHTQANEVFWIGPLQEKGCAPLYGTHPHITHKRDGRFKLIVKNPDRREEQLGFALGFQDGDDLTPIRYDPVWGNKNGGVELAQFRTLATGAGLLGLLAVGGWAVSQALSRPARKKKRH